MGDASLDGVWRAVEGRTRGRHVRLGWSHLAFAGDRMWEVTGQPGYADQTRVESTFEASAGLLKQDSRWVRPDGTVERSMSRRARYEVRGHALRLSWAAQGGEVPPTVEDDAESLHRYTRETHPALVAAHRIPPGPIERVARRDPALGELRYDAGFEAWDGTASLGGRTVRLRLFGPADADDAWFAARASTVATVGDRFVAVRAFAAAELYEVWDSSWREEDEDAGLDVPAFAAKLTAVSLGVRDDGVELLLGDGGLSSDT